MSEFLKNVFAVLFVILLLVLGGWFSYTYAQKDSQGLVPGCQGRGHFASTTFADCVSRDIVEGHHNDTDVLIKKLDDLIKTTQDVRRAIEKK